VQRTAVGVHNYDAFDGVDGDAVDSTSSTFRPAPGDVRSAALSGVGVVVEEDVVGDDEMGVLSISRCATVVGSGELRDGIEASSSPALTQLTLSDKVVRSTRPDDPTV